MPDGFRIAPHFHPADEHVTVLAGTFAMGTGETFDAQRAKAMPAGSYMVMPKGQPHFATARGETVVQVHAIGPWSLTYVNPADDPRKR
jgi:quercetin dioxygenase-like cupin family protein